MRKYFVISDTHSFFDLTIKALKKKGFVRDNPDHYIILCGDLFDRGDQSREILEFVQSLGDRFIYVRGNHEDLLFDCVQEIVSGKSIGSHHYSNGTVKTISQLSRLDDDTFYYSRTSDSIKQTVWEKMKPILDWIDTKSIDYYELGDYIFVHGWIPTDCDGIDCFGRERNPRATPMEHWDNVPALWKQARWSNGMAMWKNGVRLPNKTIVCGHWTVSYAWSHIEQKYKERPPKNYKDWQNSFQIYERPGIVALDACTAYTNLVNVYVINKEEDENERKENH